MRKRILCGLLTMTMVAMSFVGCGAKGESESQNTIGSSDGDNTIKIWCWDETFNIPAAERAAEIYQKEVPDFKLDITNISHDDIVTKLTAAATGGQEKTLPDIMLMADTNIKKFVSLYPDYFIDLKDSGIDFNQFAQYKVHASTIEDKIYAVPFDNATSIAVYRTDLLEQAGLTIEDLTDITWDEFIEKATPVVQKMKLPMITAADKNQLINCMLQSTGHWYFDENGELDIVNNEGLRAVFEVYKKLTDAGILQVRTDMDSYYSSYFDGSTMGTMNACWIMNTLKKDTEFAGKWRITNMPRFGNIEGATNAGNTGGASWVVLNTGKKDLAIDYLKHTFAGSPELYNTLLDEISAVATYLPAKDQPNYKKPQEFYGGQPVFEMILGYSDTVPRVNYGVYTAEVSDAIRTALTDYRTGKVDLDTALKTAEENVSFLMK